MKRKYSRYDINKDLSSGMKIKDVMVKYNIKTLKTIHDIKKSINTEPNGRLPIIEYLKRFEEIHNNIYEYPSINDEYVSGGRSKITIKCKKCNDLFKQTISHHIYSKSGCPNCGNVKKHSIQGVLEKSKIKHGENRYSYPLIYEEKINALSKITIKCNKCDNIFKQKISNHLNIGNGCPKCQTSKGELVIKKWLDGKNITYIQQHRFPDCKNIKPLPFDFYLPDYNMCIEYDGEQHFIKRRNESVERFNGRCDRDLIKNKYCLNNNINLIRITYKDDIITKLNFIF